MSGSKQHKQHWRGLLPAIALAVARPQRMEDAREPSFELRVSSFEQERFIQRDCRFVGILRYAQDDNIGDEDRECIDQ